MNKENLAKSPVLESAREIEAMDNVLDFPSKLRALREDVSPTLVKQREGWRDGNGKVQMVDYVEWHTVADILDQHTPSWMHRVKDIKQIGKIATVTVAITIDGITREGIGTGFADSEMGIKKAEHDALKRAAVKFGIARDLYKKEKESESTSISDEETRTEFPANPIAKSLADLVTAKQLGMIRAISRKIGVKANDESQKLMKCSTDELSKRAASSLISHLQQMQREDSEMRGVIRRAS